MRRNKVGIGFIRKKEGHKEEGGGVGRYKEEDGGRWRKMEEDGGRRRKRNGEGGRRRKKEEEGVLRQEEDRFFYKFGNLKFTINRPVCT